MRGPRCYATKLQRVGGGVCCDGAKNRESERRERGENLPVYMRDKISMTGRGKGKDRQRGLMVRWYSATHEGKDGNQGARKGRRGELEKETRDVL